MVDSETETKQKSKQELLVHKISARNYMVCKYFMIEWSIFDTDGIKNIGMIHTIQTLFKYKEM